MSILKLFKLQLLLTIFLFLFAGNCLATDYYVSPDGNNANPGSQTQPFKSIQYAIDQAQSSDSIYVSQGTYTTNVVVDKSGIKLIGENKPIITASGHIVTIAADNCQVEGFEITGGAYGLGVRKVDDEDNVLGITSNVTLLNNFIHDNSKEGIRLTETSDVLIQGGEIYENGTVNAAGIWLEGKNTNISILDTKIYSKGKQRTAIEAWEADQSSDITLRNLEIYGHSGYGATLMADVDQDHTLSRVSILNCHFKNNKSNLLLQRADNSVIANSVFESATKWGADIYTSNNVLIKNNLFINNGTIGLEVNAGQNNKIYHNVFYGNQSIGLFPSYINSGGTWPVGNASAEIKNNIIYNNNQDYYEEFQEPGITVTIVKEANLIGQNPLFVDANAGDFHLQPTSPAIDAGVGLGVNEDFEGNPRPQGNGFDIGAYEYQTVQSSPSPSPSPTPNPACLADLNGNQVVDLPDIDLIRSLWKQPCSSCPEDLNQDGQINLADIAYILTSWGQSCE